MTTTATHNEHDTTTERVLFVAFELSEKTWKLGFTTGPGQKPRERTVAARHQARLLQEVAQAKPSLPPHLVLGLKAQVGSHLFPPLPPGPLRRLPIRTAA